MSAPIADLLRVPTVGEIRAAAVREWRASLPAVLRPLGADWCACNDHDIPTPCRCEPVKKASAT